MNAENISISGGFRWSTTVAIISVSIVIFFATNFGAVRNRLVLSLKIEEFYLKQKNALAQERF